VARAVNVVRFLQEKAKVPARRLVASGHAETHPVASNATPKGRARNRRIELLLVPDLAAVPASNDVQPVKGIAKP
jgi:chemotaxis protein MotB